MKSANSAVRTSGSAAMGPKSTITDHFRPIEAKAKTIAPQEMRASPSTSVDFGQKMIDEGRVKSVRELRMYHLRIFCASCAKICQTDAKYTGNGNAASKFQNLFSFPYFNFIQTDCFDTVCFCLHFFPQDSIYSTITPHHNNAASLSFRSWRVIRMS
jgi:hypothetical protein